MHVPFAARLRQVRRAKDLTQQQLGEKAGVHFTTIARIETGSAKQVYPDTIAALARALEVSADYFLGLTDTWDGWRAPATPLPPRQPRTRTTRQSAVPTRVRTTTSGGEEQDAWTTWTSPQSASPGSTP